MNRRRQQPWTLADEARLRRLYPTMKNRELAVLFGRSHKAVASRAKVLRIQKAIGHGGRVAWTAKMDRRLCDLYPWILTRTLAAKLGVSVLAASQRAQKLGIHKSAAYLKYQHREEGRRLWAVGMAHRFPKGHVPANKGIRRPGYAPGRMATTQFRKGQVARNSMPMWSFRLVEGYLMLKTGKRHSPPNDGWEYVHKLIWEQAKGPLPGWRVARLWWKDGDHLNCALSNLELVKGSDHMARTTVQNLPAPLKQVIQLKGVLKRRIRRMEEDSAEEHDGRSPQPSICSDRSIAG